MHTCKLSLKFENSNKIRKMQNTKDYLFYYLTYGYFSGIIWDNIKCIYLLSIKVKK